MGADIGYQENFCKFNSIQRADAFILAGSRLQALAPLDTHLAINALVGNIYAGYMFKHKYLFLGVDGFVTFDTNKRMITTQAVSSGTAGVLTFAVQLDSTSTITENTARPGIEIRPGINISSRFSLYLLLGMLYDNIKFTVTDEVTTRQTSTAITKDTLTARTSHQLLATEFGLGVLYAITPHVYLTLIDRYTLYPDITSEDVGPTVTAIGTVGNGIISKNQLRIARNNVLLGMLFKFT